MFQCTVCRTMGRDPGACGVCGGTVNEISSRQSTQVPDTRTISHRSILGVRIGARLLAWIVLTTILFSAVAAGAYVTTRPPNPTCANQTVNYPTCNICKSDETFNQAGNGCLCTNGAANPPYCDRLCPNNAINPPGCDLCLDSSTDPPGGFCSAGMRPYGPEKLPATNQQIQNTNVS